MSIEFDCPNCQTRLRLGDERAGHRAKCPVCEAIVDVPTGRGSAAAGGAAWRLQTSDGKHYGPVTKHELDRWVSEGRVTADSHLWYEGWDQWRASADVYPQLAVQRYPDVASLPSAGGPEEMNPYVSPASMGHAVPLPTLTLRPHRGALVLVFGILGLVFCALFGVAAWVMGRNDLAAMDDGLMDRSGYGLTQAGWICGIISTLLFLLGVMFFFGALVLMVLADM